MEHSARADACRIQGQVGYSTSPCVLFLLDRSNLILFGDAVHIDAQGFIPVLPDAHALTFPVLTLPPSPPDSGPPQTSSDAPAPSSYLALVEVYLHRLFAITSVPLDLLIPPYSTPLPLQHANLQQSKMAMHPELPVVAIAQAKLGGSVFLFDLRTNQFLKYKLTLGPSQYVKAMAFSKYNNIAVGTAGGDLLLYELNLSVQASTAAKLTPFSAVPQYATLLPPQFPCSSLLGEITDLSFDHKSGRYLAVSTTRSGTWIYDPIHSSALRLSKYPSAAVAFSPTQDFLAVAQEKTGVVEFYQIIRAGTLTFGIPTFSKSGAPSTVTNMQWCQDGKTLLYSNHDKEGIRILRIKTQAKRNPIATYGGSIDTPVRMVQGGDVPFGGVPTAFALDTTSQRLVVSYAKSPLLEVFALPDLAEPCNAISRGVLRGPSAGKLLSEKLRGKKPEGRSPFEEDNWAQAKCVDMGFVGQALGEKGSLFSASWNGDEGGKVNFVAFYLDDIRV